MTFEREGFTVALEREGFTVTFECEGVTVAFDGLAGARSTDREVVLGAAIAGRAAELEFVLLDCGLATADRELPRAGEVRLTARVPANTLVPQSIKVATRQKIAGRILR